MKEITMEEIMGATFNELGSSIRATFKKTVNTRQYESETVEASTTLDIETPISGVERMIINSALQAQVEYGVIIQMAIKGHVTKDDLRIRKSQMESDMNTLLAKAYSIDPNFKLENVMGPMVRYSEEEETAMMDNMSD